MPARSSTPGGSADRRGPGSPRAGRRASPRRAPRRAAGPAGRTPSARPGRRANTSATVDSAGASVPLVDGSRRAPPSSERAGHAPATAATALQRDQRRRRPARWRRSSVADVARARSRWRADRQGLPAGPPGRTRRCHADHAGSSIRLVGLVPSSRVTTRAVDARSVVAAARGGVPAAATAPSCTSTTRSARSSSSGRGGEHHGGAAGAQRARSPSAIRASVCESTAHGRLVQHQHLRVDDQRAGQREPLALPAGERPAALGDPRAHRVARPSGEPSDERVEHVRALGGGQRRPRRSTAPERGTSNSSRSVPGQQHRVLVLDEDGGRAPRPARARPARPRRAATEPVGAGLVGPAGCPPRRSAEPARPASGSPHTTAVNRPAGASSRSRGRTDHRSAPASPGPACAASARRRPRAATAPAPPASRRAGRRSTPWRSPRSAAAGRASASHRAVDGDEFADLDPAVQREPADAVPDHGDQQHARAAAPGSRRSATTSGRCARRPCGPPARRSR